MSGKSQQVQGENTMKLDVLANDLFVNMLSSTYKVAAMVSEQKEEIIFVDQEHQGKYIVCFDPLDGASNIDCLASIGSIFSIFRRPDHSSTSQIGVELKEFLQTGRQQIAAGYTVYGSATMLVITLGNGVHGFTLDPAIGEFVLTNRNMRIPNKGSIYSTNDSHQPNWSPGVRRYLAKRRATGYSSRYVGSMVADVHRTVCYGGIFMYPGTIGSPTGKLRLLYECFPMAFIVEQAGGAAVDGVKKILDIQPTGIHQSCPVFLGSCDDVNELMEEINTG